MQGVIQVCALRTFSTSGSGPTGRLVPRVEMAIRCTPELRWRLITTAQGLASPDLLIRGARTWNAYTGELEVADIAVCGDRIAKIGEWSSTPDSRTEIIDASGLTAVPGYIEPHTHPWPFCNPLSLGERAVCHGVSSLVFDQLMLSLALGTDVLRTVTQALTEASLPHIFWLARISSQSRFNDEATFFGSSIVRSQLETDWYLGTAEMTRWTDLLDKSSALPLLETLELCREARKINDGHLAGARNQKLAALAATGIRSCHEATTAEEALERLRLGLWVLLRNSSLREDLPALLGVIRSTKFFDRIAFTTDGAGEPYVDDYGVTDHLIAIALSAGIAPNIAYRLATLNPATFLGLDDDLGAIGPGRVANVNLLDSLAKPTPRFVISRGRLAACDGRLTVEEPSASFPWRSVYENEPLSIPSWGPRRFVLPVDAPNPFPAAMLVNGAITRINSASLAPRDSGLWPQDGNALVLAATDRRGRWITRGIVQNMGDQLRAVATTYTTNAGAVVLGATPELMSDALARLLRLGGGVVAASSTGEWFEFPLPLGGIHSSCGFTEGAAAARRFNEVMRASGYSHSDPKYTLLFLTCDMLPEIRAIEAGWYRVKDQTVLFPAERIAA